MGDDLEQKNAANNILDTELGNNYNSTTDNSNNNGNNNNNNVAALNKQYSRGGP